MLSEPYFFLRAMRLPVRQSLARESFQRDCCALRVIDAEFGAGIHAEVEFRQITVKVFVIHVLINTDQSALEDREESLKGIGVNVAACPLVLGVVNRFV